MLWQRLLTAAIGIPLAVYVFYSGGLLFLIGIIILALLGQREMMRIVANLQVKLVVPVLLVSGIIFNLVAYYLSAAFLLGSFVLALLFLLLYFVRKFPEFQLPDLGLNIIIMIYPALLFSHLILIRNLSADGFTYIFLAFLITWSSDTFAYFTGRAVGTSKLAPALSPAKTREGALGGIVGTALVALIYNSIYLSFSLGMAVFLGVVGSLIAQTGDLFASGIKRLGKVKDSGNIFPGHGGILDRFDSILFLGPVLYYFLLYVLTS